MFLSIVIPARNEQDSLISTVESLERADLPPHEIVVVDDHSSDRTWEAASALAVRFPSVRPVRNEGAAGFGRAILAGFAQARGDAVVPVMADGCDEPETLRRMWERILAGADVVCGSRYMRGGRKIGGPAAKTLFSRAFGHMMRWGTAIPTVDSTNAFKAYRRGWEPRSTRVAEGFSVSLEWVLEAWFAGARVEEVPTTWRDRTAGASHFRMRSAVRSYGAVLGHALRRALLGRLPGAPFDSRGPRA